MSTKPDSAAAEHALVLVGEASVRGDRFRDALRAAYRGRHDVLDALWWRVHPLTVAPSGAADPATRRAELQALAFSRPEGESDASNERSGPLAELERALHADAADLDRALAEVRPLIAEAGAEAQAESAADDAAAAAASDAPRHEAERAPEAVPATTAEPVPDRGRRHSGIWMWTTIAAGALLVVAVGLIVLQATAGPVDDGIAQGAGAASTSPTPTDDGSNAAGLTIFEDPSKAPEIPPANIDPYYQPDTLRLLGVANSDLTVYAVQNRVDEPCLLAVYTDGTQSAVCVSREEFQTQGIQLRLTSLRVSRATDPAPYRTIAQDVVFWNSDGSYGISSSTAR